MSRRRVAKEDGRRELILSALVAAFLFAFAAPRLLAQEVDVHNPVGITGIFNGNVTTGCSYDPLSHSTHREITDIVVPGSIGKYPLKMTRYYNSRGKLGPLGPEWRHEYAWSLSYPNGDIVTYPNGNVLDSHCQTPVGVSDRWESRDPVTNVSKFRLADGGTVVFTGSPAQVTSIIDPYGQTTTIQSGSNWMTVTEPGGRYLKFFYTNGLLTRVEAHGLGTNTVTDWVNYSYTSVSPGGNGASQQCLTRVDYSSSNPNNLNDNTHAHYTYTEDNVQTQHKVLPLLATASDNRYHGPMRQLAYDYQSGGPHGAITAERLSANGYLVSRITPGATLCTSYNCSMETDFTETRGDEPSRTFTYTNLNYHSNPLEPGCPEVWDPQPPSQFLRSYTDFQGHRTWLGYDSNWYVNSVTDARGTSEGDPNHTTTYTRGDPRYGGIGEILSITHPAPGGGSIQYTYYDHRYLMSITDERTNKSTHTRDPDTHHILSTDYRDVNNNNTRLAYEEFAYCDQVGDPQCGNQAFGQLKRQHLKNGAYVHYRYDSRGLLIDKWEPTWNPNADDTDPKTHYDYYTSGWWTDRLMTKTLPANYPYGYQTTETYQYETDANGNPAPGRGLITKIIHTDGTFQRFGYDAYGNKLWEENELSNRTSYAYDLYNRVLTVTNPLGKVTSYTYKPTNGTGTSSYLHTTNNPDTITTPVDATTSVVTKNVYDENFRKISSTAASGTSKAATTWFHYDNVGNQDYVTDPRGSSTPSAQWTTYTDYDNRNRKWRVREPLGRVTQFYYDDKINVTRIIRPDNTTETKAYDGLNRILTDTVPKATGVNILTQFQYYAWNGVNGHSGSMLWKVIDGENHTYQFEYDPSGLKTKMIYPDNSFQSWAYDDTHNLESRTTVAGETQYFGYDSRNRNYAEWWDNNAEWRYFVRDDANRLIRAENGTGSWGNNVISDIIRSYDDAGHLTADQQNVTGLGIKSVNYPTYDDSGKLLRMYVGGVPGYDYTFSYDEMGRFEKIFATGNPNRLFQYSYDGASNETQRFNWYNQVAQNYRPDELNRTTSVEVKNTNTNTRLGLEAYEYYPISRLHTVTREGNNQDQFVYYLDGELQQATYGVSATPPPTPTPPPSPTPTPTPPGGQVAEPRFNPDGGTTNQHSLNVIISTSTSGAQMRYTTNDPTPPSRTYGTLINGSSGTITLSLGHVRLQAIAFKTGMTDSPVHSADFDYDNGEGPMAPETVRTVTYNLNKAGNRTSVVDTGVTTAYTPNNLNQYTAVGGLTVWNGAEHELSAYLGIVYTYLNDEHLTRVAYGTNGYDLAYDALGRCVKRTLNIGQGNVVTYYIYDGEKPILEYNANGGRVGFNLYGKGIDEIIERGANGTDNQWHWYFPQQDHEGSVTHLTDASGAIIERYRYDAFGAPTIYAPNWAVRSATIYDNRFLFTGREYAATYRSTYVPGFKFYEYRARAYNPALGRFTSEDPKGFDAGDYNLFRYCHNDPIDLTDPMGLEVGFGESLIPIWGSGHTAYDAFNEGRYGMAAFHAAMAITDVTGAKAVGAMAVKASLKSLAKTEVGRAITKTAERKAATGYRYVSRAEANSIRETGTIPTVGADKQAKNVFFTNERFSTGAEAKTALSLDKTPQFRVEFDLKQAPAGYGGLTEGGHVEFTLREGAQPITANKLTPLDDAFSLDQASRHTPPKYDQ